MTILLAAADAATNFQGQPNAVGDHVSIASGDERTISFRGWFLQGLEIIIASL